MSLPGFGLHLVAVALVLGEGCTWGALVVLLGCLACGRGRALPWAPGPQARLWAQAVWGLAVFFAAGAWAWWAGPYGLLRPSALGHWLPVLAWPIVACAAPKASSHERATCVGLFIGSLISAASINLVVQLPWLDALQAWVRPGSADGGQSLMPGALTRAVGGLYFHRLKMAHVLLVALSLPAAMSVLGPTSSRRAVRGAMATASALTLALALTFARGAYLGAAAGFAAVWLSALVAPGRRLRHLLLILGITVMCGASVLGLSPSVRARLLSSRQSDAAAVRSVIWSQAVAMVSQHPWGIGLVNYPTVVAGYYAVHDPLTPSPKTYPHSLLLMAWAEGGPLGLMGFAYFWGQLAWVGLCALGIGRPTGLPLRVPRARVEPRGTTPRTKRAAAALVFMVSALFCVGLTHDVLFHNIVALCFFCALGIVGTELAPQGDAPC